MCRWVLAFTSTLAGLALVAPAAAAEPAREPRAGAVLDLCALGTVSDGTSSVRQRALVLGPAGFERLDRDAALFTAGASRHARETFIAGLPLDRLYQVVTTVAPDPAWPFREQLPVAELARHLADATTPAVAGGADRDLHERALAAYSASCADWLIVPVVDSASWSWRWYDPPTNKLALLLNGPPAAPDPSHPLIRGNAMLLPDLTFTGRVGAYRRQGDHFERVAVVNAGSASDVGMPDYPPADWGLGVPNFLSAIPDADCAIGAPRDGAPSLRCTGILDGRYISKGKNEFSLGVCRARNFDNPDVWIACIARLEAEKLAGGAQRKLRAVPGLNLFDDLRQFGGQPSLRIGRHEGVKVGYGFYIPDERGGIASYFKVTKAGSGGLGGDVYPTILHNRFGPTPIGARVHELPQSNLYLAPRLEGGLLGGMSGPTTMTSGPLRGQSIELPTWAAGVAIGAAWDFSGTVGSPEWRTMAEVHFLGGATSTSHVGLLLIDWPSIEKGFYVGPRLKAFASLSLAWGWVFASANESARGSVGGGGASLDFSGDYAQGTLIGLSGTLGLEYMLHPNRLLRFDLSWRTHAAPDLTAPADTPDLALRGDHYNALLLRLGLELGR